MIRDKGKESEDKVVRYLENKGFKIIARNYRKIFGEIDIIAFDGNSIWFFEVKTQNETFSPIEKMDGKKLKRMLKVAESFIAERDLECDVSFALAVVEGNDIHITRIDVW